MSYYPKEPEDPNAELILIFIILFTCVFCYYIGQFNYAVMLHWSSKNDSGK